MSARKRLLATALRYLARPGQGIDPARECSAKFAPLLGAFIGALGGLAYWLAAQFWPTSVAVVLSMAAMALLQPRWRTVSHPGAWVLMLLLAYNALMGLSAANLPFALPPNVALGVIMVCAHAASRALLVSMAAGGPREGARAVAPLDLALALALGFVPAALLGISGLMGLAAAIITRIALGSYFKHRPTGEVDRLTLTQQLTELGFYLGALATWNYAG